MRLPNSQASCPLVMHGKGRKLAEKAAKAILPMLAMGLWRVQKVKQVFSPLKLWYFKSKTSPPGNKAP